MKRSVKHVIAVVPAAGLGKRFDQRLNKPFLELRGKPLLIWPLEIMEAISAIKEIIPVLKKEDLDKGREIFKRYGIKKIKKIAIGGRERQDSVYNGLKLIEEKNSIVIIHDGVRPFIEKNLIEKAIQEFLEADKEREKKKNIDGLIFAVPPKDTIKEVKNGIIKKTLKRDSLWAIQTPQIFHYKSIFSAYKKASKEGFYSTDDAALIERSGGKIKIIMGAYENIKITTPEDLYFAEFLVSRKDS